MPELPEVETVRAGLQARISGRVLSRVDLRRKDLRIPFPPRFRERLEGQRLESVGRRGKYLVLRFDGGPALIAHLGMSGRMIVREGGDPPPNSPGSDPHEHVLLQFTGGVSVAYRDPRRFGLMTLAEEDELMSHPLLATMGPEPLGVGFNGTVLLRAFRGRRASVKALLMDQRVVAGLGNIYVCEALFRGGIAPAHAAGRLRAPRVERLAGAVQGVLTDAIAAGGSSLRDYVQVSGGLGYFQQQWKVYGREGRPCGSCRARARCRVERIVQSGRSTFWCSRRQR